MKVDEYKIDYTAEKKIEITKILRELMKIAEGVSNYWVSDPGTAAALANDSYEMRKRIKKLADLLGIKL